MGTARLKRNTGRRNGTADLFRRICELTMLAHRNTHPSRLQLAERWNMTTRAVSYVISYADSTYGVRLRHDPEQGGYALVDPGIINLAVLERWKR